MPKPNIPIENLIADLHGSDWQKRCDAARMLGQTSDPRAVDALLPDLQDSDWKVRRNAVQALGALKSARAVEPLKAALKDRTATVRERAAVALGHIKDPQTIPALVEAVIEEKDDRFHVNEGAYQAVRKFGRKAGPALVDKLKVKQNIYLVELLADSKYEVGTDFFISLAGSQDAAMRRVAFNALGKSTDPLAVDYLMKVLDNENIDVQTLVVQALGNLRAVQAASKLLDLLKGHQLYPPHADLYQVIRDAFQNFSGINKELKNTFPAASSLKFHAGGVATNLSEFVGRMGDDNFQKLNQILTDAESRANAISKNSNLPPEIFQTFADQTWKFGAMFADARDAKSEEVKKLLELLKSDVALTRAAAALSLPWYMDRQTLEALEHAATRDEDEMVRRAAAWAHKVVRNE